MLEYEKTDNSKDIDINEIDDSREHIIYHYWYIFKVNVWFQPCVCESCHDIMQKSMSFEKDVAILCVGKCYYRIRFWGRKQD